MSKSVVNLNYVPETDASQEFISEVIQTNFDVASIAFQVIYENPPISGVWYVEATIFPDKWEVLDTCEPFVFSRSIAGHEIIVLPQGAVYQEWLRLRWKPNPGSQGTIRAAMRILSH